MALATPRSWVRFPGKARVDKNVKTVTWMQCKSLWIKASAKCINVNVNVTRHWKPPVSDSQSCEPALWSISTLSGRCEDSLICAERFHSAVYTAHQHLQRHTHTVCQSLNDGDEVCYSGSLSFSPLILEDLPMPSHKPPDLDSSSSSHKS